MATGGRIDDAHQLNIFQGPGEAPIRDLSVARSFTLRLVPEPSAIGLHRSHSHVAPNPGSAILSGGHVRELRRELGG